MNKSALSPDGPVSEVGKRYGTLAAHVTALADRENPGIHSANNDRRM
jgi:hypothetical protein